MSENEKNVPKRRFKEFNNVEDWEHRKLGNIAEFNPKAELPETFEYVDLESVVGTEMIAHREEKKATAPSRAQRLARKGDLFYQTVRPYQKNNYLFEKSCNNYVFSTGYAQMRPYGDGYLLLSLVQSNLFVKSVLDRCTGTSYPAISSNDLADTEVYIPVENNEQTKIGTFYKNLDNFITLHQRKLEKMKALKKAYLTEMFSAVGESKPKLRFAGFTDDWEQRKLRELTDVYDGTHQTPNYKENGIMFLSVENIKTLQSEKYISEDDFEKDFKIYPQKNDVLMTRIGDIGTTNVVESDAPKAYYVSLALLKHKELNPYFLKESISSEAVKKDIWQRTLHIAFPKKINKNEIANVGIIYPKSKDEQEKIGTFFYNLDNIITLHQRKLEKLQNIKKAYLNEMFI